MSKRIQAKHKLDRRMGQNIWGRPKSPVNRREYGPGQHGQRRKGKMSARMTRVPNLSEVPYAVQMEPNLVIEFYSR